MNEDLKDEMIKALKHEVESHAPYKKRVEFNIALAKEAIGVLEDALKFYKDEVAQKALSKLDEIRRRAKS